MGPLHNVLNRVHAWNEGYTFKSVICSRVTNFAVSTPLSGLAIVQNALAVPFAAIGTAGKMIVKPVAWISGSNALHRFANQLPGITDLLQRIANIIRYIFSAVSNATLGVLSPSANFRTQCALGTTYDKQAVIRAVQELARRAVEAQIKAEALAVQQAETAKKTEQEAAAAEAKKAVEQAEVARKAAEFKKIAEQAAAEAARRAAEKATVEATEQAEVARKATEQSAQSASSDANQVTEIELTDELEISDLLSHLMEDDEYDIEEEVPTAKQPSWIAKILSKFRPATQAA